MSIGKTAKARSHIGKSVHQKRRIKEGTIGMITVIPFSILKFSEPDDAKDNP